MSQRSQQFANDGSSAVSPRPTRGRVRGLKAATVAALAVIFGFLMAFDRANAAIVVQMGETGTTSVNKLVGSSTNVTINLIATNTTASPIAVNLAAFNLSWIFSGTGAATDLTPSPNNAGSFVVSDPGQLFDPIDPSVGFSGTSPSADYTVFTNPIPATTTVTLSPNVQTVVGAVTFGIGSPVGNGIFTFAFDTNSTQYGFGNSNVSENFIQLANGGGVLVVPESGTGVLLGCAGATIAGGTTLRKRWQRRRKNRLDGDAADELTT